jgi:hypothetical protein
LLAIAFLLAGVPACWAEDTGIHAPLTADQVADQLALRNDQRARALAHWESIRNYSLEYRGIPGDRRAEMVVHATYTSPSTKVFKVISTNGSQFVIDRVFGKLLEGEQEAAQPENQKRTALSRENYDFTLVGYEEDSSGSTYILRIEPKTKDKFLYRGTIWVDGRDFALKRIQAEPVKNPSFWTKNSEIVHEYGKFGEFWLPVRNESVSKIRLGGKATLTIEYGNYRIVESDAAENARVVAPRRNHKVRNAMPIPGLAWQP